MKRVVGMLVGLASLWIATSACAQIVIGQTAGITGTAAAGVKETTDGAKLYLDSVNAKGGVNGQTIELISMDDKFDPKLAAANAKVLITEKNVVALFLNRGTPHTQAIMPLLAEYKVPLVGPSTGAMALHKPVNPWVFNVRATYQREAECLVQHLSLIGRHDSGRKSTLRQILHQLIRSSIRRTILMRLSSTQFKIFKLVFSAPICTSATRT